LDGFFSDHELWRMVSYGAAVALGARDALGALQPGRLADIVVFDAPSRRDYRAVVDARAEDVLLVLRGGQPIVGDAALVTGLLGEDEAETGCEPVTVCGAARRWCVARDTGQTVAALEAAGSY